MAVSRTSSIVAGTRKPDLYTLRPGKSLDLVISFSEGDKRVWHEAKLKGERQSAIRFQATPVIKCILCGQPSFGLGQGFISDEVSLCDAPMVAAHVDKDVLAKLRQA